ncbi:hypothetical protein FHL15_004793 [Xylaria flabelliformis]|uniref:Uncharacterized protein n=1 Tax=Xylaria flabelliformis TaxID=2512241 RepID=A0A553I2A5_9PEZI|nr:hypothetical protein FHL15_004793 [Xylaria flabelliformis]
MDANSLPRRNESAKQPALYSELMSSSGAEIKILSPVLNAFTPINRQRLMNTQCDEHQSIPLSISPKTLKDGANVGQKRIAECRKTSVEKRPKIAGRGNYPTSTKQLTITPTQTPSSFYSLKVTKPVGKFQDQSKTKEHYMESQESSTITVGQFTPQPTCNISQVSLNLPGPRIPHSNDYNHLTKDIAINRVSGPGAIPYSKETGFKGAMNLSDRMGFCNDGDTSWKVADAIHNTATIEYSTDSSDAYPLDDGIVDDDIVQLLVETSGSVEEKHIPPSSIQGWDHESRSAAEYDPSLKYSPPDSEEAEMNIAKTERIHSDWQNEASEDLLDEDVDWDAVMVNVDAIQRDISITPYPESSTPKHRNACAGKARDLGPYSNGVRPLTAFVRPPFPNKVRDRPSVPGMSSNTLLRTCFRIDMMTKQTTHCYNHKQDVVFELYARVTYSSRETLARRQHFQFVDLYEDREPYPAAILSNWRMSSQLDKDSSAFLDTSSGPRLCWCMCKPMRDSKAAIGWIYKVLNIREVDQEQLHWAKRIMCAESEKPSPETVPAKL